MKTKPVELKVDLEPSVLYGVYNLDEELWALTVGLDESDYVYATPDKSLASKWALMPCACGVDHRTQVRQASLPDLLEIARDNQCDGVSIEVAKDRWEDVPV